MEWTLPWLSSRYSANGILWRFNCDLSTEERPIPCDGESKAGSAMVWPINRRVNRWWCMFGQFGASDGNQCESSETNVIAILSAIVSVYWISRSQDIFLISYFCSCYYSYEERKRSLDTISSRHKDNNTFEDFTARIYHPLPAGNTITAHSNSSLASAMIDNSYRNQSKSKRKWNEKQNQPKPTNKKNSSNFFTEWSQQPVVDPKQSLRDISAVNIDQPSPRGHRKLHPFKSAPKKHSTVTPPDSPTLPASSAVSIRRLKWMSCRHCNLLSLNNLQST